MSQIPSFVSLIVADAMEKAWKSGLCVEARIDEGAGRDVKPGEQVGLTVAARHRVEQADVDLPIDAQLTGVASIEPAGKRQTSPGPVHLHRRRPALGQGHGHRQGDLAARHQQTRHR